MVDLCKQRAHTDAQVPKILCIGKNDTSRVESCLVSPMGMLSRSDTFTGLFSVGKCFNHSSS